MVPLNQSGYGALIGESIQSAQELYLKLGRDPLSRLEDIGAVLLVLTDPPDLNLVCFAVNRAGNTSLERMNRLNRAIYDRLRFHEDQVMQGDDFMMSSTVFEWDPYGETRSGRAVVRRRSPGGPRVPGRRVPGGRSDEDSPLHHHEPVVRHLAGGEGRTTSRSST